jgi:hypothetical protein
MLIFCDSPDYDEYQQIVGFTPAEFAYQPPPFNVVWNYAQIRSTQELLHANRYVISSVNSAFLFCLFTLIFDFLILFLNWTFY